MAIRLHGWLHEKFEGQLLLGNDWLRAKNIAKAAQVKSDYPGDYTGLYHDNGSCLDIILAFPPGSAHCNLQVVQANPLTLTDGKSKVTARLDPACLRSFLDRFTHHSHLAPRAVLAVRDYTIRYTSYGPPPDRLQLIVHTAKWIGVSNATVSGAVPLHQVDEVSTVLQLLDHTRALQDRKCLQPPKPGPSVGTPVEEQASDEEGVMAPALDDSAHWPQTQQPYSQEATFATQMAPAIRSRTSGGKSPVSRVDRTEPAMAETMQPSGNGKAPVNDYAQLLGLLKPKSASSRPSITTPSRPLETRTPRQSSSARKFQTPRTNSPTPVRRKDRVTDIDSRSPTPIESPRAQQVIEDADEQEDSSRNMECSWMKGFVFNSESTVPDSRQASVLSKPSSWYKTQPGVLPFPERNIPIVLWKQICAIVDENVAAQGHTQSDDEDPVDPSPESDPADAEVVSSLESVNKVPDDDEPKTSQISWSASSSPEPPQRPNSIQRGLPPDSSLETGEVLESTKIGSVLPAVIASPAKEKEPSAPPSSPPGMDIRVDSDEEMEMEISIPHALGDDTTEGAHADPSYKETALSESAGVKSIIQVRETPYAKSRHNHISPRGEAQSSSQMANISSSTSIVLGTCDQPSLLTSTKEKSDEAVVSKDVAAKLAIVDLSSSDEQVQIDSAEPTTARDPISKDAVMLDSPPHTEEQVKTSSKANIPEDTLPPSHAAHRIADDQAKVSKHSDRPQDVRRLSASGSTKRKLAESPTKSNRRNSKRLKIVKFGDSAPPSFDPTLALQKDLADSFQRFREARKPYASFESRAGGATRTGAEQPSEAMNIDASNTPEVGHGTRGMSPRHQSLYDEPSSPKTSFKAGVLGRASPRSSHNGTQSQVPPTANFSRASVQMTNEKVNKPASEATQPSTILGKFRAAYPEYTGNEKQFKRMCSQMYELDQEDKMVPKWQWDDFIIRNKIDYGKYLMDCADEGENPDPYHRFYKDTIRDTIYQKGVVGSRKVLLQALKELGAEPPAPPVEEQPHPSKTLRKSLPSVFNQPTHPTTSTAEPPRQKPRHSLPVTSQNRTFRTLAIPSSSRAPTLDRSSSKLPAQTTKSNANLLSRLSLEPTTRVSRTPESTGDPFRDFYFAVQRTKSVTGSDAVSSSSSKSPDSRRKS
ncbi:hypothetical protein NX059_005175 [Plenodomus lindquistii]|nr:hypothetical protein NX059_005175 [Plenodomus lindquistii]